MMVMLVVLVFLLVQHTMKYLSSLRLNSPNLHRPQGTIPDYLGVPLVYFLAPQFKFMTR